MHFLLTKLTENDKNKNLIEAMLRRLEKVTKQLWDTVIHCSYIISWFFMHNWHFYGLIILFSADRSGFIAVTGYAES